MDSTIAILAICDGLSYAALVFLVSVGLSLIFGVLRIVNVAHGSLYAYGAYTAATLSLLVTPISPWLAFPALPTAVPLWAAVLGVVVSMAIGLFFGIWPANKAARLDPVVALRYE